MHHVISPDTDLGTLSIAFRKMTDNDEVILAATPDQKKEIAEFIRVSSQEEYGHITVECTGLEELERILSDVQAQVDNGDELKLSRPDFNILTSVARAWKKSGYVDLPTLNDENYDPVSESMVETLITARDACYELVGTN